MKVVLATIHSRDKEALFTPLALLYLKSYLVEQKGFPIAAIPLLEFRPGRADSEIVEEILSENPDVVGLSCYIWNIQKFRRIFHLLKERNPRIKLLLGGPEVGPVAVSVLEKNPAVDAIIKGEGERVFADLVETIQKNDSLAGVNGIAYRDGVNIHSNPDSPILHDLNELPSPHKPEYGLFNDRQVCLETQRGCVFRCSFCFYNKDYSIRNRRFDLERVKQELLYWMQKGVPRIYLMDPIFNLHADRAKEICRFIIANNTANVTFHTEIWAEFVDEEMAELFQKANFQMLEVGLQTTEESVLSTVERRFKKAPFTKGLQYLRAAGLRVDLHLIFGLPGETLESFRKAIDYAVSLEADIISIFTLMVLPGTALWRQKESLGLCHDPEPCYEIWGTPSMPENEIAYGKKFHQALIRHYNSAGLLLAKISSLPFSEVLDQWILWSEENKNEPSKRGCRVEDFIEYFCQKRSGLDASFFLALHRSVVHGKPSLSTSGQPHGVASISAC
jgi:anaerobic magnesium-protoporphyrin IX monomethyl ester cyclase